ncbi:MAG: hypothetical protein LBK57_07595 [Clostridiales Family XIII bacterium]|jgi:predicted outer membrane repeat protein|nr:hypothetical protein [Clostridiales Family XIII bacterium]
MQNTLLQRRVLSAVTILALIVSLFAWTAATAPATYADVPGDAVPYTGQTAQGDYTISTAAQLAELASVVNTTAPVGSSAVYSGSNFYLINDINLANSDTYGSLSWTGGTAWTPIGGAGSVSTGVPATNSFAGTFSGYNSGSSATYNTYTISGLNIPDSAFSSTANYGGYGLFGYVGVGGAIMHLTVSGTVATTKSINVVGGIVGYSNGTLYNLHNEVNVSVNNSGASQAGGVAGTVENNGSTAIYVQYCSNEGTVLGRGRVGGIVGAVYCANVGGVVVDNCFNEGNLTTVGSTQKSYTGGIVGYCRGYITNSYSIASLETSGGHYMAGITGILQGSGPQAALSNAYSYSLFNDANASYDRFLFASTDNSNTMPIANALWVNTNSGSNAPWENGDYNNVTITQPNGTGSSGWGSWTDVGFFASGTTPTYDYTSKTLASVYTAGAAANEDNQTALTILNSTSSIVTASGTVSVAGAFEQISGAYPSLIWQRTPDIIGETPGTPGTLDSDDATQIFLDGTLTPGTGTGTQADPYADLSAALGALATGRTVIYVVGQVSISDDTTVTSSVAGATIKRSSTYKGYLFNISEDTLTLSNIIVDGNIAHIGAGNSLIYMTGSDAELVLGSGAVLQNNLAGQGGAIYATGAGMITLDGGTIQNNIASTNLTTGAPDAYGGAIYLDNGGTAIIESGLITGNKATSHIGAGSAYGGAIYISDGNVEMSGGTISGNSVDGGLNPSGGGGVYVGDIFTGGGDSEFRLDGGTISGNTASEGGGVYVASDGEFAMFGGSVTGNTAETTLTGGTAAGGGVYIEADGEFDMEDASVLSGNTAVATGSGSTALGAGVYDAGSFSIEPDSSGNFTLADVVYLTDGTYISVAATLANITGSITVQCASPADEVQVAAGSGYTLTQNDVNKFAYYQDSWSFYLDSNGIYIEE